MPSTVAEIAGWEFLLVIAIIVLLFGGSRIPKVARSLSQARKEFRRGYENTTADKPPPPDPSTGQ